MYIKTVWETTNWPVGQEEASRLYQWSSFEHSRHSRCGTTYSWNDSWQKGKQNKFQIFMFSGCLLLMIVTLCLIPSILNLVDSTTKTPRSQRKSKRTIRRRNRAWYRPRRRYWICSQQCIDCWNCWPSWNPRTSFYDESRSISLGTIG